MSNYHVEPVDKSQAITSQAIKSLRQHPVQGISRRRLLRVSIGGAVALWLTELTAGTIGFLWPNLKGGFGGAVKIGKLDDVKLANASLPIAEGFPAYVQEARAFIVLYDPSRQQFVAGEDKSGDGAARTSAASPIRASRTSGSSAPATAPATTASARRHSAPSTGRRRGAWTGSPRASPVMER
jgi:hypothetical protein